MAAFYPVDPGQTAAVRNGPRRSSYQKWDRAAYAERVGGQEGLPYAMTASLSIGRAATWLAPEAASSSTGRLPL